MLTGEAKNKIDSVWDTLWSNGNRDPFAVIEQITYLIFIKTLDDNQLKKEANASVLGTTLKNKTFPDEGFYDVPDTKLKIEYRKLRWSVFRDFNPEEMHNVVANYVFPFIKNLDGGNDTAFTRFMKDAMFTIKKPAALASVVDDLDSIDLSNMDAMGDVYEYLLEKMATHDLYGQYRTPRHIIRMMVQLMKPTMNEKILDPAMGTGGFLIESASYISDKYSNDLLDEKNSKFFRNEMFNGFDNDDNMLKIGAMNLMLHDINNPNIQYKDSLSADNNEREKYDLILSNPPFSGSLVESDVKSDLLEITHTNQTELLFISLFIKMLKVGGRCACIVPEGVLFRTNSDAYKALRSELVENQRLRGVISMPGGIFKPYAGVSTAIIIFDKTGHGGTDNVWFYNMKADGYSLDDKREPIEDNDIPDIIARFENPNEFTRTRKDQSFYVPKQEIKDNGYDLRFDTYKEMEYVKEELPNPKEIMKEIKNLESDISKELEELEKLL